MHLKQNLSWFEGSKIMDRTKVENMFLSLGLCQSFLLLGTSQYLCDLSSNFEGMNSSCNAFTIHLA